MLIQLKRHYSFLVIGALLLNGLVYGQDFSVKTSFPDPSSQKYMPNEILVGFKPGTPEVAKYKIHRICGVISVHPGPNEIFERVKFGNDKTMEEMIAAYKQNPEVSYAEPNYIAHALFVPNDPLYDRQWHLHSPDSASGGANFERAWNISTGTDVVVAVVDTGVAYEDYGRFRQAPDLMGACFIQGYDYVDKDSHANDENGHGTLVAGIIAQNTDNNYGVAGAAFGCCIMPVRVLDEEGYGLYSDIIEGVNFAIENGANVINLSLGADFPSTALMLSLSIAYDRGVVLVAAGGNEYSIGSPSSYPAAYDRYCISVGAVRYDGRHAWYSTTADYIDISAPGGDLSVDQNMDGFPDGILQQTFGESPQIFDYIYGEGTSFAAPQVSAAVAMLMSHGITEPDQIVNLLQISSRDKGAPGWDSKYGWGILDSYTALKYASKMLLIKESDLASILFNQNGRLTIKSPIHINEFADPAESSIDGSMLDIETCHILDSQGKLPYVSKLHQNYPNPFNPETWIPYQLCKEAQVVINIYTSNGQLVRTLDLGRKLPGFYTDKESSAYWDGRNEAGEQVAGNIYFYSIKAGGFISARKMIIEN